MSYDDSTDRDVDNSKWGKKMTAKSGSSGPSPAIIGLLVVAVVAIIFVLQNNREVKTEFLFFDFRGKFWFTLLLAILIGVGLDRLFTVWWRRRKTRKGDL